ncbi:DUF4178 domain-containing protein [Streptomyces sp. NPDC058812]|uniref:DUF4178 domain-containing protein n=1 Tax=unclassified Streptomyces TaxID=2593676 RepID=UPI0036A67196
MAGAPLSVPGREHALLTLEPGARLPADGTPGTVRAAIQVRGATQRWAEYLLEGGERSLWLAVEQLPDGGVRLSRWSRTTADAAGFDPSRPVLRGVRLAETERGHADFEATGAFDGVKGITPGRGRLHYIDYAGPGVRTSLERFAPDAPGLLGIGTEPGTPGDRTEERHD